MSGAFSFARHISNPQCPGPRNIYIFGDYAERDDFEKFLQQNEIGAVIIDDTDLVKTRAGRTRTLPLYTGWLGILRKLTSGQYNLGVFTRYLYEINFIGQEMAKLMRDNYFFFFLFFFAYHIGFFQKQERLRT